jgi:hypothetical protein
MLRSNRSLSMSHQALGLFVNRKSFQGFARGFRIAFAEPSYHFEKKRERARRPFMLHRTLIQY